MAFDEQGHAVTLERKVSICSRAYALITEQAGIAGEDIVFDPNIFAIATGIDEHNNYAVAFINACREIKQRFPLVHISGGVSNVSFSRSEEHTSELQSLMRISYAVFCLKKKIIHYLFFLFLLLYLFYHIFSTLFFFF